MRPTRRLCSSIRVRALASNGSGIGDMSDGRVVFIPRTVPGDQVDITLTKSKKRLAEGKVIEFRSKGPTRVSSAACPLYNSCGGCQLQHMTYEAQLDFKSNKVAEALRRIGGFPIDEEPEVVASSQPMHYRTRMSWTLRRLGGYKGFTVAGLHELGRPGHIVDIADECVLPVPEIAQAWSSLRNSWGGIQADLLPQGGSLRLTLRIVPEGVELLVNGGWPRWDATELYERNKFIGIHHIPKNRPPVLAAGHASLGGGTAFEQVNPGVASLLQRHVVDICGNPPGSAVDAYCGVGSYGRALSECGWNVVGLESDESSVKAAINEAPQGFSAKHGLVEDLLQPSLPTDVLILNPPRTGVQKEVIAAIRNSPPSSLVYVSCDPATLSRDLKLVSDLYSLESLRCFDLFPQTAHVETVAQLTLKDIQ